MAFQLLALMFTFSAFIAPDLLCTGRARSTVQCIPSVVVHAHDSLEGHEHMQEPTRKTPRE